MAKWKTCTQVAVTSAGVKPTHSITLNMDFVIAMRRNDDRGYTSVFMVNDIDDDNKLQVSETPDNLLSERR